MTDDRGRVVGPVTFPLFGGWTPTWEGDHCKGGHPPQSVHHDGEEASCGRCGRLLDLRRCLCGDEAHWGLSRSFCPNRMRMDQRDAEEHADVIPVRVIRQEPVGWEWEDCPGCAVPRFGHTCWRGSRHLQGK